MTPHKTQLLSLVFFNIPIFFPLVFKRCFECDFAGICSYLSQAFQSKEELWFTMGTVLLMMRATIHLGEHLL